MNSYAEYKSLEDNTRVYTVYFICSLMTDSLGCRNHFEMTRQSSPVSYPMSYHADTVFDVACSCVPFCEAEFAIFPKVFCNYWINQIIAKKWLGVCKKALYHLLHLVIIWLHSNSQVSEVNIGGDTIGKKEIGRAHV